jgi:hypothetical protein
MFFLNYSKNSSSSMMTAIARVNSRRSTGDSIPIFRMNLWVSRLLVCNASVADVLVSPFSAVGSRQICQRAKAKEFFQSVIGTTNLRGSFPIWSELMTMTGRVLRISAPMVGFSLQRGYANEINQPNFAAFREHWFRPDQG